MFKPMLASEPDGLIAFPKLLSAKLDGIRVVTKFGDALTRSLKPVPNHHIREMLRQYQDMDGEVIVGDPTAPDCYRKTNSAVMSHEGTPEFTFFVFDSLGHPAEAFTSRTRRLAAGAPFITVLPQAVVNNQQELDEAYASLLAQGYEGAILRNPDSLYKYGRATAKSGDMLKMKPFADSEAVIVSAYEAMENQNEAFTNELGQTERSTHQENKAGKGMVGGFIVRDIKSGIEFNCSAGKLNHEERTELWGKDLAGKILKYRYMPYGQKTAPRFPRFIGWRSILDI